MPKTHIELSYDFDEAGKQVGLSIKRDGEPYGHISFAKSGEDEILEASPPDLIQDGILVLRPSAHARGLAMPIPELIIRPT